MSIYVAFIINVVLFSVFPLLLSTLDPLMRRIGFYSYLSVILVIGGVLGSLYSFQLTDDIYLSGGNLAYGSFMMSAVMLFIMERKVLIFNYLIKLLVFINLFVFFGFNFILYILENALVINPFNVDAKLFDTSLGVLLLGGALIATEFLILMQIFIKVKDRISHPKQLMMLYSFVFILVICLDGVLFPLIAVGVSPELLPIMISNLSGKLILAISFSFPLFAFYCLYQNKLNRFVDTPMALSTIFFGSRVRLALELDKQERAAKQLIEDNQKLINLSHYDHLTGLANRRKYDDYASALYTRAVELGEPVTLVLGDIDHFKKYNDFYGHQSGDECLQKVAEFWKEILPDEERLTARVGGEEFAVIVANRTAESILPQLERDIAGLTALAIPHAASSTASIVTMSIGVASMLPSREGNFEPLFETADKALYQAKNSGRNRISSLS
ncbi:diguanylate cyclase [Shewanella nanhaiensis]|uniref:diguanylate cyclase n=1 Tax=Shewanella nanhaiensis TaxID=2864872 RepID=A0ABS7E009_9GAMM|nr:diguanylate cyclase [Shewanella nanhaiensis]MBW8182942.1 GGDEF domain-containing protein [Shewanella nanhaiensis]